MSEHHCPTCGCPVKVGGKGTTKYYVPINVDTYEVAGEALAQIASNHPRVVFDSDDLRAIQREIETALASYVKEKA